MTHAGALVVVTPSGTWPAGAINDVSAPRGRGNELQ